MVKISNLIVLTVSRDGHYLRLHRTQNDFKEIQQYRACERLVVKYNNHEIAINALQTYNVHGAIESAELSAMLTGYNFKPKDKVIAEVTILPGNHQYRILGRFVR